MDISERKTNHSRDAANIIIFGWRYKKLIGLCTLTFTVISLLLKVTIFSPEPLNIFSRNWILSISIDNDEDHDNQYLQNVFNSNIFKKLANSTLSNNSINENIKRSTLSYVEAGKNKLNFRIHSELILSDKKIQEQFLSLLTNILKSYQELLFSDFKRLDANKSRLGFEFTQFNKKALTLLQNDTRLDGLSKTISIQTFLNATIEEEFWEQAAYTIVGDNEIAKEIPKLKSLALRIKGQERNLESKYGVIYPRKLPTLLSNNIDAFPYEGRINSFLRLDKTLVWSLIGVLMGFSIGIFIACTHIFFKNNLDYIRRKIMT